MKVISQILSAILLTGLTAGTVNLRAEGTHEGHKPGKGVETKPYPAATCLIWGEKLDSMGKPVVLVVDGQEIKFCCRNCVKDYNADKGGYLKILARAEVKAKPYLVKTCVVSGDEFDHGKAYVFYYEGHQVKLCRSDCLADFKRTPAKYAAKIADAQTTEGKNVIIKYRRPRNDSRQHQLAVAGFIWRDLRVRF